MFGHVSEQGADGIRWVRADFIFFFYIFAANLLSYGMHMEKHTS